MVGKITREAVVLWRHRPWIRSDFRPAFYGRFEPQDAGARLDGHFALRPLAKAFMALCLGAVACLLVFAVIKLLQAANPWGDRVFVGVAPFILLLGGVGMLHLASRWAATDIEYLSRRIHSALAGDETQRTIGPEGGTTRRGG